LIQEGRSSVVEEEEDEKFIKTVKKAISQTPPLYQLFIGLDRHKWKRDLHI